MEDSSQALNSLFDAHCHLQDQRLKDLVDSVMDADGTPRWLAVNGVCPGEDWDQVAALAAKYPGRIIPNFGVHPWWFGEKGVDWEAQLRERIASNPEAGVGETGIDRTDRCAAFPLEDQIAVMDAHIRLARQYGRPTTLHNVRCNGPMLDALQKHAPITDAAPLVLHSFQGPADMIPSFNALGPGVYFSLSGSLAKIKREKAERVAREVPFDRLLVETDSPDGRISGSSTGEGRGPAEPSVSGADDLGRTIPIDCSLEPAPCCAQPSAREERTPRLNHPKNLAHVIMLIAQLSGRAPGDIAAHATRNAMRVFHFAPTSEKKRIFGAVDIAALWVGLVVCLPTYYLAGGLVEMGMAWWQGILTVLVGNVITLVPMVLNAHPGTKYGVPFPVLARASFGILGANIPSMMRALVACGWFGIQTYVGAQCLHKMLTIFMGPALTAAIDLPLAWLGITTLELAMFVAFWAGQVAIILKGIESIKEVEKWSAPVLIFLSAALLAWAYQAAGGFGPMLSAPSQFGPGMPLEGKFWDAFVPAVTANVGFWATLSLNIPDFTRYAKSQRDQLVGQTVGLPLFMAAFTFVGLAVTSSTIVLYGQAISDPIQLLGRLQGTVPILIAELGLLIATLSTNIAANVVAPANAFVNLAPKHISFTQGGLIAASIGLFIQPWNLIRSSQGFMNWLIGYSVVMGPIAGILVSDYFFVRNRHLDIDDLYKSTPARGSDRVSRYWFTNGINWRAPICLVAGILPSLPGLLVSVGALASSALPTFIVQIYNFSWFIGFGIGAGLYYLLMRPEMELEAARDGGARSRNGNGASLGPASPDGLNLAAAAAIGGSPTLPTFLSEIEADADARAGGSTKPIVTKIRIKYNGKAPEGPTGADGPTSTAN